MAVSFWTIFSDTFSLMKMHKLWLRFHWNLFPRVHLKHISAYCRIYASMNWINFGQVMACRLLDTKPLYLTQCCIVDNYTLGHKLQGNLNQNTKLFIHENALENVVCEMAAILSRGRWVNTIRAWVQVVAWRLTHICLTRPQRVNMFSNNASVIWPYD